MKVLTKADLDPQYAASLTTQSYSSARRIDGVKLVEQRRFTEDGGSFAELLRLNGGQSPVFEGFEVKQVNCSDMEPGTIKAWHLHFQQEDVWFVPPTSKLLVGLWDVRAESATKGATMRLVLGDGKAQLLYIPRGVGHGAANITACRQTLIYFVNNQFDAAQPDEHRLDAFALGREFWQISVG